MRLPLSVRYPPPPITARPSPRQIETLASSLEASGSTANIARLGIWGELYLVPLAGAKAILCRYCQSGMLLGSDNQLRMLSGPECASPPADFPPPIGSPYKLRAQPGAGHNHDRDVTRRAARLGGVGNHTVWLGTISGNFQERARVEMKRFPAQPAALVPPPREQLPVRRAPRQHIAAPVRRLARGHLRAAYAAAAPGAL